MVPAVRWVVEPEVNVEVVRPEARVSVHRIGVVEVVHDCVSSLGVIVDEIPVPQIDAHVVPANWTKS